MIQYPIITSVLDNDLYSFTVGQLAFFNFPDIKVRYEFFNRGNTVFPDGFNYELENQLKMLSKLKMTPDEKQWIHTLKYIRPEYIEWLSNYQFDPSEVTITQINGKLSVLITGTWTRTIMWEVVTLAIISELYYTLTDAPIGNDWMQRIKHKAVNLSNSECLWIDFGTRRRFSLSVQYMVVDTMKSYNGFLGTSNTYLAYKHKISPMGTMSHQFPMIMSALYGVKKSNSVCLDIWHKFYGNDLLIFLPDTFGTEVFLRDFDYDTAKLWTGLRQDSGNPMDWIDNKIIPHYQKLGISLKDKKIIFSDNLTDETYKELSLKYRKYATIIGGIGTNLSNDMFPIGSELKRLNIVIKATQCNNISIIKLSDSIGKYTGDPATIKLIKAELGI